MKVLCIKFGIHPARSRGQNFVIESAVIDRMVEAAEISPEDCVVEIGPGFGVLTVALAEKAKKVVAVEIDTNVIGAAEYMLEEYKNVELVKGDILKMSNEKLTEMLFSHPERSAAREAEGSHAVQDVRSLHSAHASVEMTRPLSYKVVSNLPYSITSKVLRKFTESEPKPSVMVLMVQKEVAERVCALPGEMSMLSVAVQYYGKPEIVALVSRNAFWPEPEVDSAILRVVTRSLGAGDLVTKTDERHLFQIVRIGFSSRRKQLQNNLTAGLHISREQAFEALRKVNLPESIRPQELSVDNWIALAGVL